MKTTEKEFIIQKNEHTVTLPDGTEIPHCVFLGRMGSMKFDVEFTTKLLQLLPDGGKWGLVFNQSQSDKMYGRNYRKNYKRGGGKGFA